MSFFIDIFYQPFLNFLVVLYYGLDFITGGHADMGVAVILFTIAIRILLLPLTISSSRSEDERRKLEQEVEEIKQKFAADQVARNAHIKSLMRENKKAVISSSGNLIIQTILALMLWRIFAKGLLGADFHLLYDFVPQPTEPFNLTFLGKYDLTHPNATLNALQSIFIFILEAEIGLFSPFPMTRHEVILMQFTLPIGSYVIFSQLPAGKKLFIITTLLFSIVYVTQRQARYLWHRLVAKMSNEQETRNNEKKESIEETEESTAETS